MNRTDEFLNKLWELMEREIPEEVIKRTKLALLDYIGVTLAGLYVQGSKEDKLLEQFSVEKGSIYPVGMDKPVGMNEAVFLNGLNAHALDFDDGTNAGIIHLGSPIFSVLLALAQKYEIDSDRLLKAAVFGYEASFTMARSIQPALKLKGYHATGTCGVLGIAVAAAYALGMSRAEMKNVFSVAAVSASGTLKVLEDGSDLKPYNVAKSSVLGLISLQMARAGFVGADDALSGIAGYLTQMYGDDKVEFVPVLLDGTYAVQKAYIKPYAACRYTHPSIDVAAELRGSNAAAVDDIESVNIKTYSLAVKKHDHTDIRGAASAKMSIPYNFAVTYLTGKTGMDAFADDVLNDEDVLKLTRKVAVEEDEYMTEVFPGKTIATVELKLKDGTVQNGISELPKGEPENPLSDEEAIGKFTSLAVFGGKTREEAEKITAAVMNNDIPELLKLLR